MQHFQPLGEMLIQTCYGFGNACEAASVSNSMASCLDECEHTDRVRLKCMYICQDAVVLLTDAALQAEGQVMAADHDTAAKSFLEGLHVWLDTREVQSLAGEMQTSLITSLSVEFSMIPC